MAVVVARQNAKKKGKGNSQGQPDQGQFSEVIKASFPRDKKSFKLTSEKVDGGATKAYVKSMVQHALMHYENFVKSSRTSPGTGRYELDILDLIHYHVMGDYRAVVMRNEESPSPVPTLGFAYSAKTSFGGNARYEASNIDLSALLNQPTRHGHVYGVYRGPPTASAFTTASVPWLNRELNVGSSGQRLMLPSIGTQVISIFGYDADPKLLQNSLFELSNHLNDMIERRSDFFEGLTPNDKGDYVIAPLMEALLRPGSDVSFAESRTKIQDAHDRATNASDGGEAYRKRFFQELVTSTTSRYFDGDIVRLTAFSDLSEVELELMRSEIGENQERTEISLRVEQVNIGYDTSSNSIKYTYNLRGEYYDFTLNEVRESNLIPVQVADRSLKKEKKRWVAPPGPTDAVLYRCVVDQLAAMQVYLYLITASSATKPVPVMYLSEALTPNKSARYLVSTQYPRLRPPSHGREFEERPIDYFGTQKKGKISLKGKDALLYKLIAMRQVYTQASLQAQRSSKVVFDKRIFDDFYKDDLRLKEITWLAYALSEEGKVLLEKPRQEDPMAVLMYRRPGADAGVTATAPADLRTAFYRIDAPMIKEVYTEYVSRFNALTLQVAYQVESASAEPKAGKIAQAVWAQIRRKTADIFNEGVTPYDFFRSLFSEVNAALAQRVGAKEAYPPSWSGTNKMAQLTQNPLDLGITVTPTMYQEALVEYIEFLRGTQASSPTVASAVLSAIETYTIDNAQDYQVLRDQFLERLKDNEKNSKMKLINYHFQAYAEVLAIMRAELAIPLGLREGAIAAGIERDALRAQLRASEAGDVSIKAFPTGHPRAPQGRNQAQNINVNLGLGEGLADLVAQVRGMTTTPPAPPPAPPAAPTPAPPAASPAPPAAPPAPPAPPAAPPAPPAPPAAPPAAPQPQVTRTVYPVATVLQLLEDPAEAPGWWSP